MKKTTIFVLLQVFFLIVLIICMALWLSGRVALTCCGFAVDGAGRLYIGRTDKIEIYRSGELEGILPSLTSRGYAFTISGDTIVLSDASTVYEMSLTGEILTQYEDTRSQIYHAHTNNRRFTDENGTEYRRSSILGRMKIEQAGQLCYQMPLMDYLTKVAMIISFAGIAVTILLLLCNSKPISQKKN